MRGSAPSLDRSHPGPSFAPHLLLFAFYNVLYFVPLFLLFVWDYGSRGTTASALSMDAGTTWVITLIYVLGVVGFALGGLPLRLLRAGRAMSRSALVLPEVRLADRLVIVLVAVVFLISKIALIPLGVYHEYAFSSGEMTGGIWTFSTFCSETMVLLGIVVLFSRMRHNVLTFILISALNGINLLHGTRIFFIVTALSALLYACVRGYVTLRRALLLGPIIGLSVLMLAYVVFLSRSGSSVEGAFSAARIVRPIVDESLLSQLSLVSLARDHSLWDSTGHIPEFLADVTVNTTPRAILADKDELLYFDKYAFLSPVGGMNGYAAGLIYFGLFFPFFYFVLGFVASWLYMKARTNSAWVALYAYFTADFLFRIMRDGYLIPVKMLLNTLEWLVLIILARALFRAIGKNRVARSPSPP